MSIEVRAINATVQATVSGGDGYLSAELDNREWGLNGGTTQWFAGDTVAFLVFQSKNVEIIGTFVNGGSTTRIDLPTTTYPNLPPYSPITHVRTHVQREAISFTTPVGSISKPCSATPRIVNAVTTPNCGDPIFKTHTTIALLTKWIPTNSPFVIPNTAHYFIEYEPSMVVGLIKEVGIPIGALGTSYTNTAYIYGVSRPLQQTP